MAQKNAILMRKSRQARGNDRQHGASYFIGVMLDPPRLRKILRKLVLRRMDDTSCFIG